MRNDSLIFAFKSGGKRCGPEENTLAYIAAAARDKYRSSIHQTLLFTDFDCETKRIKEALKVVQASHCDNNHTPVLL